MDKRLAIGLIILGILIGYVVGTIVTIKVIAEMASGFIDPELVEQAIYQYKHNIGSCFPPKI